VDMALHFIAAVDMRGAHAKRADLSFERSARCLHAARVWSCQPPARLE
jgi:hypothetical protein